MKKLLSLYFCFMLFYAAKSSHIVGAELFYDCTGNNAYRITLKLYRDCYCTQCAQYGDTEYVTIFDGAGNVYYQLGMPKPDTVNLPATYTNPCTVPPQVCVTEADYTGNVVLPLSATGYTIVYQRCCRNNGVVNLAPGQGATYIAQVPGSSLATCNSSARFANLPPLYACLNSPLSLNYAAIDPDGDSLVYSLCDPFSGADGNCPDPSPNNAGTGCPTTPNSPPYAAATYATGYSSSNFTNSPSNINDLKIDPHTGLLTGTPNAQGLYDITVCVSEYRNGQLLNILTRDFQVTVSMCNIPIAALPAQQSSCKSLTVNFVNLSYNPEPNAGISYFWNFGVNGSVTDTSTLTAPSFTYPDTGQYWVQLIAQDTFNGQTCTDTTTSLLKVYPTFSDSFSLPAWICVDSPVVFTGQTISTYGTVNYLIWFFGDGGNSITQSPTYRYTIPGTYTAKLIEQNTFGCLDTAYATIEALACPTGIFNLGEASNIKLYPNPANDYATLLFDIPPGQTGKLSVYNLLGQLLIQQALPANGKLLINTIQLPQGVFNYCVEVEGQIIKRDKLVVAR